MASRRRGDGRRRGVGRPEKTRVHTRLMRTAGEDGFAEERVVAREDGAAEELAAVAGEDHSARRWPKKIEARSNGGGDEGT